MLKATLATIAICASAAFSDWSGNPLETLGRLWSAELRAETLAMQGDFRKERNPGQWPEPPCYPGHPEWPQCDDDSHS